MQTSRSSTEPFSGRANSVEAIGLEERLSYQISTLAGLLDRQSLQRLSAHRLNLVEWRILARLAHGGPTSVSGLLPTAAVDRALVSREVSSLSARGLVMSIEDKKDRRRKIVSITPAGRTKHDEVLPEIRTRHEALRAVLTEQELAVFQRSIAKLKRRIEEDLSN